MINIEELKKINQCRLWVKPPLEGITGLEKARYLPSSTIQALEGIERKLRPFWNDLQRELAESGKTENEILAQKNEIEQLEKHGAYLAKEQDDCLVHAHIALTPIITTAGPSYTSPLKVQQAYARRNRYVSLEELARDEKFVSELATLEQEFSRYSRKDGFGRQFPVGILKQLQDLLGKDGFVDKEVVDFVARLRERELPFYRAAYTRRNAFEQALKNLASQKPNQNEYKLEKELVNKWCDEFLDMIFQQIKNDLYVCKAINGLSTGKWGKGGAYKTFYPIASYNYQQHILGNVWTPRGQMPQSKAEHDPYYLAVWLKHNNGRNEELTRNGLTELGLLLRGYDVHYPEEVWTKMRERLKKHYQEGVDTNKRYIKPYDLPKLEAALDRLSKLFDQELFEFTMLVDDALWKITKTTPSQAV